MNFEKQAILYALNRLGLVNEPEDVEQSEYLELMKSCFDLIIGEKSNSLAVLPNLFGIQGDYDGTNHYYNPSKFHPYHSFPQETKDQKQLGEYSNWVKNSIIDQVNKCNSVNELHYLIKVTFANVGVSSSAENAAPVSAYSLLKSFVGITTIIKQNNQTVDDAELLFIGGDLSGIQSFIYNIISKYAAKNLKGRSFYLQLMIDAAVYKLQKELELSDFQVIYSSGGGFFLLSENNKEKAEKLESIISQMEEEIFHKHGLNLYLALDYEACSPKQLISKDVQTLWKALSEKLGKKKRNKFKSILLNKFDEVFEPIHTSPNGWRDAITNEEIYTKEDLKNENQGADKEPILLKKVTHYQIELGKKLRNANYLNISFEPISLSEPDIIFGIKYQLEKEPISNGFNIKINPDAEDKTSNALNYGGNRYPIGENNEPITFDRLAKSDEGVAKLGLLRMDVDNLGQMFIAGFDNHTSISAYTELSFRLDGFFKGYLNHLGQKEEFKERVFILYSGGDDLFLAGNYLSIIQIAGEIRSDFSKWIGGSKKPSISGGISLVTGKFPVLKGAEIAGEMEKIAKNFQNSGSPEIEKNSLCLFGIAFSWDKEFDEVIAWKERWQKWLNNNTISKSMLFRFTQFFEQKERGELKWQWNAMYTLARHSNKESYEAIEYLKKEVILRGSNNYRTLDLCSIGARLAELSLREINN